MTVITWGEFARRAPDLAERGGKRFGVGVAFIATADADGRPRLHPITPLIAEGRLFVFVALDTPKERNLRLDGRYAMHAMLGQKDEEFQISGRAVISDDSDSRALAYRAAEAIGMTTKNDVLMEFMIKSAHWAVWEGLGTPDIHRVARRWPEQAPGGDS